MKNHEQLAEEYAFNIFQERYESLIGEEQEVYSHAKDAFLAGYKAGFKEAKKYWANQPKYGANPIEKLIEDKFWEQPKPKVKL
jgi:hypothetical protein